MHQCTLSFGSHSFSYMLWTSFQSVQMLFTNSLLGLHVARPVCVCVCVSEGTCPLCLLRKNIGQDSKVNITTRTVASVDIIHHIILICDRNFTVRKLQGDESDFVRTRKKEVEHPKQLLSGPEASTGLGFNENICLLLPHHKTTQVHHLHL